LASADNVNRFNVAKAMKSHVLLFSPEFDRVGTARFMETGAVVSSLASIEIPPPAAMVLVTVAAVTAFSILSR
jgi:hypothetical protein